MKPDNFCCGDTLHCQYPTFQISTKLRQVFSRYELSKIGLVFSFFFFLSWYESYPKVETSNLIALKFGVHKGGVRAHLGTKFGYNAINAHEVICYYS